MSSIVYVLTNEAMPTIIKIGRTSDDSPLVRMDELYNTSVPLPFECAIAIKIADDQGPKLEKALHKAFAPDRVNPSREFFWTEPERVRAILEVWPDCEDVTPQANRDEENVDADAVRQARLRRPNLNFAEMGIPEGGVLVSVNDEEEEATVVGEKRVLFRGEEMFLTRATKMALRLGPSQSVPVVRRQWTYKGRNLSEIYEETYDYVV